MDVQMPEINGIEATKIIRNKGIETPIIALTANASTENKNICISAGMNDFLSKPIDKVKVIDILNNFKKL